MIVSVRNSLFVLCVSLFTSVIHAADIQLPSDPALSPNGKTLVFRWAGDLWSVPTKGGVARQLTRHSGVDAQPIFSPDGQQLAFTSARENGRHAYIMPANGGLPQQITFHSEGYQLHDWSGDGKRLLTSSNRDHHWKRPQRLFWNSLEAPHHEELVFDAYADDASLSPDGKQILFVREGTKWYRKGYRGAQAAQIWLYELKNGKYRKVLDDDGGCRHPVWKPDGTGFYYVQQDGRKTFNLYEYDWKTKRSKPLTNFDDDAVLMPCVSRDGTTLVFRRLFDFYRLDLKNPKSPQKIKIQTLADPQAETLIRRKLTKASNMAISQDGLEVVFVTGGDLWVMDTDLREPVAITRDAADDSEPVWSKDGKTLFFLRDVDGQIDLWKAERADPKRYWWLNREFRLTRLTKTPETETNLNLSPNGKQLVFAREPGELWITDLQGKHGKRLVNGFDIPDYDFSPDGGWLVYTHSDNDFNREIWVVPTDGSQPAVNISRHPDNDYSPRWSPDGKKIAFVGRRAATETDIYYVYVQLSDHERTDRDRKLLAALQKFAKARPRPTKSTSTPAKPTATKPNPAKPKTEDMGHSPQELPTGVTDSDQDKPQADKPQAGKAAKDAAAKEEEKPKPAAKPVRMKLDLAGIHERLKRISIPNSAENSLFWFGDGKTLAFSASVAGKSGTYVVEIPGNSKPRALSTKTGSVPQRLKDPRKVARLVNGLPSILSLPTGSEQTLSFSALQAIHRGEWYASGFNTAWRLMRDNWYDPAMNNRDWDAIRTKYVSAAQAAPDHGTLRVVVELMLGELNGSHLGFYPATDPTRVASSAANAWQEKTPHFGTRFDPKFNGPGLKVRDVLPNSPAARARSRILPGEVITEIDGQPVGNLADFSQKFNGRADRIWRLTVRDRGGKTRTVLIQPITWSAARSLLYQHWIDHNEALVTKLSRGRFGYVHIQAMNSSSFLEFEKQLYNVGYQKEGLVIDVRENGGGSTTDHLLTALTQPRHAVTVPRGGGPGYPQDRTIYAVWDKPIVVLCNQNSFSNAEIFSHAIKNLERGQVVGVRTAGGVISTGAARVIDLGLLRQPFRGWYVKATGEDMELNGAKPHHELWPLPGELPAGIDRQLTKAVEVLDVDVAKAKAKPTPRLRKASEREE